MAKRINMAILFASVAIVTAGLSVKGAEAAVFVVGDTFGWQIPTNSTFYSSWASSHNFSVGDTLLFNFTTGVHDVANVTLDAYTNCNASNTLTVINTGPANVPLTATGMHYYICTFPGHCSSGQKLAVNVGGSTSSTPSPPGTTTNPPPPGTTANPPPPGTTANPPPPPPPPPPPGSSATSTNADSVALMWMSIALGFMFI
ncbi:hypothetical protein P3X46_022797 [Hevea brasiliensis]|uniref:Phytocyanin domain-containing protein n=1 Tax=Hevea brasiliensis TaxID=3981 RepID=A0ABQ9LA19_HEVBR|nr:umecyanin [Hevea brasiliensis]KAJ9163087.1 hypothetical protein P3X46_022797 [Hevea brasiliensis]